jgi:hypothetical protein
MFILSGVLGVVLILIVLGDAFETIVLPRRVTRQISLAHLLYQYTWLAWSGLVSKFLLDPIPPSNFPILQLIVIGPR